MKNMPQSLKTCSRVTENIIILPDGLTAKIILPFGVLFFPVQSCTCSTYIRVAHARTHLFLINKSTYVVLYEHSWHNDAMRHRVRLFEDFQRQLTVTFRNHDPRKSGDWSEIIHYNISKPGLQVRYLYSIALTLLVLYFK